MKLPCQKRSAVLAAASVLGITPEEVIILATKKINLTNEEDVIAQNLSRWRDQEYVPDYVCVYAENCTRKQPVFSFET